MAAPRYRGFSTASFLSNNTFMLTGKELVKRDLVNHIYTIKGERPHMPDFGTRIPLIAFEPLDEQTIQAIREDLTQVFEYDPRVQLLDMVVTALPDNNAISVFIDILYVELNERETLKLEFATQ